MHAPSLSHDHHGLQPATKLVPLSMGFSRQEYWSGLPLPTSRDLPDPGIKLASLGSPALADRFFTTAPPGKPIQTSLVPNNEKSIEIKVLDMQTYTFNSYGIKSNY